MNQKPTSRAVGRYICLVDRSSIEARALRLSRRVRAASARAKAQRQLRAAQSGVR